jgi:DNA-binding PadR family transcriptional regulator
MNMEQHNTLMRRAIGIPKGFLSYGVLRILSHTPMSGSELMEEMENRTGWRPSPGSVYPLLAKLREGEFIEEVESEEAGLKRFALTAKGKELLNEYEQRRGVFGKKFHSIRRMWLKIYREMDEDLYETSLKLFEAVEGISPYLKGEAAKESAERVRSLLAKTAEEIEDLRKSLRRNSDST